MSKEEQVVAFLIKLGCKEIKSTSSKYRKFTSPNNPNSFYWVGHKGALRAGKTVGETISISFKYRKEEN